MHTYPDIKLLIDGEWRDAVSGKTIAVSDPATDEIIGAIAHAEKEDLDLALAAAERGFRVWRDTSPFERSKIMRRAADLLRERKDKIAYIMTREQGKPLAQSGTEIMGAADTTGCAMPCPPMGKTMVQAEPVQPCQVTLGAPTMALERT